MRPFKGLIRPLKGLLRGYKGLYCKGERS